MILDSQIFVHTLRRSKTPMHPRAEAVLEYRWSDVVQFSVGALSLTPSEIQEKSLHIVIVDINQYQIILEII